MQSSGRSRSEWRNGHGGQGRGLYAKKRSSCSPLRKRRRSRTPGDWGKEHNEREVLRGIYKDKCIREQSSRSPCKGYAEKKIMEKELKISRKTISQGTKPRRSPSPGRRWGHESVGRSPTGNPHGSPGWRRRSRSPCNGARKSCLERSPQRFRSRDPRGEDESLCSQRTRKEEEVRMGDVRGMEGWLRSSSKDHQVDVKRKRSFSKEDFVSSTSRNDTMDVVEGNRVYISWDRFVTKSFLDAHFSRFGEVEFIWMARNGAFFGFVNFVSKVVGRSLVGACHNVEGVQIEIKKAKPDGRMQYRDRRRVQICAFFKEGRCLRHGHCKFLHTDESRRRGSRSRSRERARRTNMSCVDRGAQESEARRDRDGSNKMKELKKEGRKSSNLKAAHLKEGFSERDGRLRQPASAPEETKAPEMLPHTVSAWSDEARKREYVSKEEELALRERIRQLEEALKEKEEAEDRKRRFLMAGKSGKKPRVKDEEAKLTGQSSRGSRKNCHLVRSLAKRYKGEEKKSTSSSSEDTDGYDSTSEGNTPSQSPSPPGRKLKVSTGSLGNPSLTDFKVKTPDSRKNYDETAEVSGQEANVADAVGKNAFAEEVSRSGKENVFEVCDRNQKEINEEGEESEGRGQETKTTLMEAAEREVPCTVTTTGQDYNEKNEEQEFADEGEEVTNEELLEDEKKNKRGEEDGIDVNENMLGSEKETDCSEVMASADLCKVRVESECLISRLGKLESDFDAEQEEEDACLELDFKRAAEMEEDMKVAENEEDLKGEVNMKVAEMEEDMKVSAEERAKKEEAASKKVKYPERLAMLVMLVQERDRLQLEEIERLKASKDAKDEARLKKLVMLMQKQRD